MNYISKIFGNIHASMDLEKHLEIPVIFGYLGQVSSVIATVNNIRNKLRFSHVLKISFYFFYRGSSSFPYTVYCS